MGSIRISHSNQETAETNTETEEQQGFNSLHLKIDCDEDIHSGLLYQNSWQLEENISVRYAVRYKPGEEGDAVDLGDVFIDLEDCRNLLTIYHDGSVPSDESLISTIWTVDVDDREMKFCPLTEFVYQAAVVSGGTQASQVFRGIIKFLVVALVPEHQPAESALLQFREVPPPSQCRKQRRKSKRKRKSSRDHVADQTDAAGYYMEERQTAERLELIDETNENEDDCYEDEYIKSEPRIDSVSWESYCSSDEETDEKPKKKRYSKTRSKRTINIPEKQFCTMCSSSFKSESSLYLHQLESHPNDPDQHIAKPSSLIKRGTRAVANCRVCGVELRGATKEYKHYIEHHPDYPDKPRKPEYLINKEIELETGEKPRKREVEGTCKECGKEFATIKHLYNHCRREHPDQPEICPLEPVRLGPIRTLHERLPNAGENRDKFQCGVKGCNLLFDRFLSLVDHERTGHPDSYVCILCGLACYSADSLISHSDSSHAKKATYICRICGFFNRNSRGLSVHTQQEHMKGTLMYQCEKCAYTSGNYVTFNNHKRTAHLEENSKYVCEECGNNFATKQSLGSHRRLHNPDFKKFQCKYCPRKFGHSSVLLIHMRVHTGEKPFSCNICSATFGSQTASIRHRRVVHANENDMRFQCQDCGKKYPSRAKRDFENHCKTHTGVRDHVCELCGSAYFSKKGLRKHERVAHPAQNPIKPKPFKIGTENQESRVPAGLGLDRGGDEGICFVRTSVDQIHQLDRSSVNPQINYLGGGVGGDYGGGDRRTELDLLQAPEREPQLLLGQPAVEGAREGLVSRVGEIPIQPQREGDLNIQLAYAAALNRQADPRLPQFFSPLRN